MKSTLNLEKEKEKSVDVKKMIKVFRERSTV